MRVGGERGVFVYSSGSTGCRTARGIGSFEFGFLFCRVEDSAGSLFLFFFLPTSCFFLDEWTNGRVTSAC